MTERSRPLTETVSPEATSRSVAMSSGSSTSPSAGTSGRPAASRPSGSAPNRASEVTAESVSIRIWPTETGSVSIPEVSSQTAAWSVSTWESAQEISSPRVGVKTIWSAGSDSMAEMFWWARPRVRPVSSTNSRVSRVITPIISAKRPLAWTMSLSATNMTPCHRLSPPSTSAPEDGLRDRKDDADRSVRTMVALRRPPYSEGVQTDQAPELTSPFVDDAPGATTPATMATTLRGAMHVAFVVLLSVGVLRAVGTDGVPVVAAVCAAAVIAVIYVAGSRSALRRGAADRSAETDLLLPGRGWVLALTVTWMASTLVSTAFVWIAFPLFFLVLFARGRVAGPLSLAVVALCAVLAPVLVGEQQSRAIGDIR